MTFPILRRLKVLLLFGFCFFIFGCSEQSDTVKITFIGPLTGGVSAGGLGGRNSADLAIS